jgi:hypothetical protein
MEMMRNRSPDRPPILLIWQVIEKTRLEDDLYHVHCVFIASKSQFLDTLNP